MIYENLKLIILRSYLAQLLHQFHRLFEAILCQTGFFTKQLQGNSWKSARIGFRWNEAKKNSSFSPLPLFRPTVLGTHCPSGYKKLHQSATQVPPLSLLSLPISVLPTKLFVKLNNARVQFPFKF